MSGNTQYLYIGNENKPLSELNGYESGSFVVGAAIPGDPAYGCAKNFVSNYMCGTQNKTLNLSGEAGGKKAIYDCTDQIKKCNDNPSIALMQNDGNFVIYKGTSVDDKSNPKWASQTSGTTNSTQGVNLINGPGLKTSLTTGGKLFQNEKLINSNKNGVFYMDNTGNIKIDKYELNQAKDAKGNIIGVGGDAPSFALYELNPKKPAKNLFKTGYVDIDSNLHEYPNNLLEYKNSYATLDNINAAGNDIVNLGNIGKDACEKNCNANANCGVYQMDKTNGNCWLKTEKAYTSGNALPNTNMAAYLRMKGPINKNYEYKQYKQMDSSGHDIKCTAPGEVSSKKDLEVMCNKNDACAAYNWNESSKIGCIKNDSAYSESNTESNFASNPSYEYNVKIKSSGANSFLGSCSRDVQNINSSRWDAYTQSSPMNSNSKCGLAKISEQDKIKIEASEKRLNELTTKMKVKINTLNKREKRLNKYFIDYYNKMERELKKFKKEYSSFKKNKTEENNVDAWTEDSEIQMIANGNKYTIFSIVAILMVFALIKIKK